MRDTEKGTNMNAYNKNELCLTVLVHVLSQRLCDADLWLFCSRLTIFLQKSGLRKCVILGLRAHRVHRVDIFSYGTASHPGARNTSCVPWTCFVQREVPQNHEKF